MMRQQSFRYLLFALPFVGCAGAEIKKVDTLEKPFGQTAGGGQIGIKDGKAIIETKQSAEDELRLQQWKNWELERLLGDEQYWLKRCRDELEDPRLGGKAQGASVMDMSALRSTTEIKESIGLVDKEGLTVVKQESYLDRLQAERKYATTLAQMMKTVQEARANCDREMGYARVRAGLPAKRYTGQAIYKKNGNVREMTREHENSLDDAFRIKDLLEKSANLN